MSETPTQETNATQSTPETTRPGNSLRTARLKIDPDEKLFQDRSFAQWTKAIEGELDRRHDEDLLLWWRRSLANTRMAIRTSDWGPNVFAEVSERALALLRKNRDFLLDWIWFALCTSRFWSDEALLSYLTWQAGEQALVEYVAGVNLYEPITVQTTDGKIRGQRSVSSLMDDVEQDADADADEDVDEEDEEDDDDEEDDLDDELEDELEDEHEEDEA